MRTSRKAFSGWIGLGACIWGAVSCGGESEGSPVEEPFVGVLIDGPVSGVFYETESLSGVTDEAGRRNRTVLLGRHHAWAGTGPGASEPVRPGEHCSTDR